MNLREKLREDLIVAQKAGDDGKISLMRLLIAQVMNREIEKRGKGEDSLLDDAEVLGVLGKEAKKRKESIELFRKGGRADLAEKEEYELRCIEEYLPAQMGTEEIGNVVDAVIQEGNKDFASAMKESMKRLKGQADGTIVRSMIEKRLNG